MSYDITKLASISAVALALIGTPVLAQEMGDWDADGDAAISEEEFNTGFGEAGVFGGWDEDGDGALSEEEFGAGLGEEEDFAEWDEDGEGSLTEDAFNTGVFGRYDADESGAIEEPEFGDVGDDMGDGGLFDI
jgi:Ca2+-binding EF-hand superfamily protein